MTDDYPLGETTMRAVAMSPEGSGGLYGIWLAVTVAEILAFILFIIIRKRAYSL